MSALDILTEDKVHWWQGVCTMRNEGWSAIDQETERMLKRYMQ